MSALLDAAVRGMGLARSLLIYRRPGRQQPLRRFYGDLIKPGDLVFDIGAHVGDRTAAFAALGARVIAVEPQPQLLRWARRLTGRKANVVFLPDAVGRCPGTAQLALSYRTPTVSSLATDWRESLQKTTEGFRDVRWQQTITVPVTTLDDLIRRYGRPAFCKIDVEGYEPEVLAGLNQPVAAMSFEFVTGALDQGLLCLTELERLGNYEYNAVAGEDRSFIWASWQSPDHMKHWLKAGVDGIASGDIYARLASGGSGP